MYSLAEPIVHIMPDRYPQMRSTKHLSENPLRHFVIPFLIALGIYLISYKSIEHRRNWKGPWQVTFTNSISGVPQVVINQPFISVTNVRLTLIGAAMPSAPATTLLFDQPREVPYDVPFGKCIFMDTTFLPGTVTFRLFGHEIELLPRVLIIDHEEHGWVSGSEISLPGS